MWWMWKWWWWWWWWWWWRWWWWWCWWWWWWCSDDGDDDDDGGGDDGDDDDDDGDDDDDDDDGDNDTNTDTDTDTDNDTNHDLLCTTFSIFRHEPYFMLEIPHLLYLTPEHPSCLMVNYPFCIVHSLFLTSWCITPNFSMVNRRLTSHFGWVSAHPLSSETSSKGGSEEDETGKVSCGTCKNQRNSWENEGKWWYSRYSIGTVQLYKSAEIQTWLLVTLWKKSLHPPTVQWRSMANS